MTAARIEPEYRDHLGTLRSAPRTTIDALEALFRQTPNPGDTAPLILRHDRGRLVIPLPEAGCLRSAARWCITLEGGGTREGLLTPGQTAIILAEGLPHGYHHLAFPGANLLPAKIDLVIAPMQAYKPPVLRHDGRVWGLAVQLYTLRSARNWGIGDFTDLADLIGRAGAAGASLVGVNPLHALFPADPERASPYSPSSRDFLNALYLDPEAIPDFAECEPARRLCNSPEFVAKLDMLRANPLVDYSGVAAQKQTIFQLLHRSFRTLHPEHQGDARALAFRAFRNERGEVLRRFALFEALQEHFVREGGSAAWHSWPPAFHEPTSSAVRAFAHANEAHIEFYEYLQWQAADQLKDCAARAQSVGMPIGLYLDIAVGVDRCSAATWINPSYWASGWHIGAPPDAWTIKGQDWGLPPPHPSRMMRNAYAGFRTMLRTNMAHAGAIRLDHVLGLMRLFWVPEHGTPADGAYVHYPFDDLLAILALESERNACMVVGEDLGTVPEGFGAQLHHAGALSYRLLYFERKGDGEFRSPRDWEPCAIAAITTHDLPTLTGYWSGADIALKTDLGLFPEPASIDRERQDRAAAREALLRALTDAGVASPGTTEMPARAVHAFLAKTNSMIAMAQLEDLLSVRAQVNMPGTTNEHPNWRRKLPCDVPELFADQAALDILATFHEIRPPRPGPAPASSGPEQDALRLPTALYRVQFNAQFTFNDATALIPYLHALGISHVYASSYLKARPGSTHGYDISDHNALNPEIGTQAEFDAFCDALREHGMGQILDFIPNHMGIGKSDNSLWLDVLEWGQASPFASFFDINWHPRQAGLQDRVLVPVLGGHYGHVLERGEIVLRYDPAAGTLNVWYADHCFPLHPRDYAAVLAPMLDLEGALPPPTQQALREIIANFANPDREQAHTLQQALARLGVDTPALIPLIEKAVARLSANTLHGLLERQHYRLAYWRVAGDEINFRRFFDINELAGLRMEIPEVFEHTHRLVGRLIGEGKLHGLRLDHLDGLYDPSAYLDQLQRFAAAQQMRPFDPADPFYVVAEKILAPHESLREDWPIAGTTGYEFIALVNGVLIDPDGERPLNRTFRRLQLRKESFDEILYNAKILVIETMLASELNALSSALDIISEQHWNTRDYTLERLRAALLEVVANFPVYRSYISDKGVTEEDRRYIDWAVARARKTYTGTDPEIFDFIHAALTTDLIAQDPSYNRHDVLCFAMRFQQYTGPVAAKSLEDTTFYRYVRLLSLNEVGNDPTRFGTSVQAFHHAMQQRAKRWPHALNATATHDTKRGEDARARLNVLSELAEDWDQRVKRWFTLNHFRRRELSDLIAPIPMDEYLIYQTLFGAWPPDWEADEPIAEDALYPFRDRIKAAVLKSLREAKTVTSWHNPHADYESATLDFIDKILETGKPNPFLDDFRSFAARTAPFGMMGSLSQTVLKMTAPGIPDCYQGTELWDHNLVDPDNRRPVAYTERFRRLTSLTDPLEASPLLARWRDGQIKLALLVKLLRLRRDHPALFLRGSYEPVEIHGAKAENALAFQRRTDEGSCLVVVGRLYARFLNGGAYDAEAWGDTALLLADTKPLHNVFTGRSVHSSSLTALLADLPVGVFLSTDQRT